jgi:hypothetical protein
MVVALLCWAGIASAQQAPYIEQQPPVEVLNASIYQCAFSSSIEGKNYDSFYYLEN